MTVIWNDQLRCRRSDAHLRNFARSGGRAMSGRERRVFSDAGFWIVAKAGIVVNTRERVAAYRAMMARLRQGEDILVPLCDLYRPVGALLPTSGALLSAPAALRAIRLNLLVSGVDLLAGQYLSIGDRLHLVTAIVARPSTPPLVNPVPIDAPFRDEPWVDAAAASAAYTVDILPPLRAAAAAGAPVSFRDLKLRCVLRDLDDGDLELDLGRTGQPSLTFIESL